ncbi:MAG: electron transport complex subunit RsxD [Candidatus Arsenophonus melophagi]|nr:electron transport complex subunit RsxD [Candidatus Arsenophonus melophagi]
MKFRIIISADKYQLNNVKRSSSPFLHTHEKKTISKLMLWVFIASIPGISCQIYFFSSGTFYQMVLAITAAFISEAVALRLRKLPIIPHLKDASALVTASLLAISIPPLSPWWLIVLGTTFAILIAKHIYGGLGQNPFNPAMVGYVVLLISFPIQMTSWIPSIELQAIHANALESLQIIFTGYTSTGITLNQLTSNIDGISQATPLDSFKTNLLIYSLNQRLINPIFIASLSGNGWHWVNIAYFIGGIILLNRRIISWQIPLAFLVTLLFCSVLSWLIMPTKYAPPMLHLFSGATMLGAFFIASDPVTAATTPYGRLIYGIITGLLTWIIRVYGGYPDAVAFSVLLTNITVPLIDHYSQPRVYGHK